MKAELRLIIVLYNGGWRRKPMPRPMPSRLWRVSNIKRMSATNWIESNGPHGKFIMIRERPLLIETLCHDGSESTLKHFYHLTIKQIYIHSFVAWQEIRLSSLTWIILSMYTCQIFETVSRKGAREKLYEANWIINPVDNVQLTPISRQFYFLLRLLLLTNNSNTQMPSMALNIRNRMTSRKRKK